MERFQLIGRNSKPAKIDIVTAKQATESKHLQLHIITELACVLEHEHLSPQAKIRYFTFAIFTIMPFACGSFGSFTTVTYNSFSPSLNATFVVPSPAAISNTCRSLPSGDIFKILPPNHWAT